MFSVFPIFTDRGICGGSFSIGRVWGECGTLWVLLRIIGRCLTFERRSIHKNLWCIYGWSIASLARQLRKVCVDARFRVAIAMQQVAGRPLSCERILYVCCWRLWHSAPNAAPFRNLKSSGTNYAGWNDLFVPYGMAVARGKAWCGKISLLSFWFLGLFSNATARNVSDTQKPMYYMGKDANLPLLSSFNKGDCGWQRWFLFLQPKKGPLTNQTTKQTLTCALVLGYWSNFSGSWR